MKINSQLLPKECLIACSAGIDSTALAHWLCKHQSNKSYYRVKGLVYFDHQTQGDAPLQRVQALSRAYDVGFSIFMLPPKDECPKGKSLEAWWHDLRQNIFNSLSYPIVTAHHFNDALETHFMGMLFGDGRILSPATRLENNWIVRPLAFTSKFEVLSYSAAHNLEFVQDPSNHSMGPLRNRIRKLINGLDKEMLSHLASRTKEAMLQSEHLADWITSLNQER